MACISTPARTWAIHGPSIVTVVRGPRSAEMSPVTSTLGTGAASAQTPSATGAQSWAAWPAVARNVPRTATHPAGVAATTSAGELEASRRTSGSTICEVD